jgi:hypothetical protein
MAEGALITMSNKELQRSEIIRQVIEKKIRQREAAYRLELSVRQIKRLVSNYRQKGPRGLIHGLRGKPSYKTISPPLKRTVLTLWQSELFHDFGPTLFSEKLAELKNIQISDETLRTWYPQDVSLPAWRRKKRPHRHWRERKAHCGEMLQTDGSHHDWFEGRSEPCNLQAYIDDATGDVFARFYTHEGTLPIMDLTKRYSQKHGLPYSIYFDKHSTYKSTKRLTKEQRIAGEEALSQFGRALEELGVKRIYANSPQAKGRIERLFKTFQDRLIKEMRLRNISSLDESNRFLEEYLPRYNKRFAKPAREVGDWHKHHLTPQQISHALCIKHTRLVQKDSTISYLNKRFLILDPICKTKITVEEHIDASLILRAPTGKELAFRRIPLELYEHQKQQKKQLSSPPPQPRSTAHKPKPNHPWRKEFSRMVDLNNAKKRGHSYVGN